MEKRNNLCLFYKLIVAKKNQMTEILMTEMKTKKTKS